MYTEKSASNTFSKAFDNVELIGFHGTSLISAEAIELFGFLPTKLLSDAEHKDLIKAAARLGIDTTYYTQWLQMRSVTFTRELHHAVEHVKKGHVGGQGLRNISTVASLIVEQGKEEHRGLALDAIAKLESIQKSPPVVYAVDLSNLEHRLVPDKHQPFLHYYWHPSEPLPDASEIGRSRLLARLDIT